MKKIRKLVAALFIATIPTITTGEVTPRQADIPLIQHKLVLINGQYEVIPEMYTIYDPNYKQFYDSYCPEPLYFDCLTNSCTFIEKCCAHSQYAVEQYQ